eukprot:Gb_35595 [translate_table: standard]
MDPSEFKGVKALVDAGLPQLPDVFLRPANERPNAAPLSSANGIPVIDLQNIKGDLPNSIIRAIGTACQEWGCFQVVNHGIDSSVMRRMMEAARDFFELPAEEKMIYWAEGPSSTVRYASSFNVKEDKILNWRDFLRFSCHPFDNVVSLWPTNPQTFVEAAAEYCRRTSSFARVLYGAITQSLGLSSDYMEQKFEDYSHYMVCNYYPWCPEPESTLGVCSHTDPGWIGLLMQDQVAGLHVLKDGQWVVVEPTPNAFVVNLGDMFQIMSNGRYKSVEHRVVVNGKSDRISVLSAYGPSMDTLVSPARELVDDNQSFAMYKECVYGEYIRKILSGSLDGKSDLDHHSLLIQR